MDSQIKTFDEIEPNYALRPYQKKAVNEVLCELRSNDRVLLHAPTGAGKTRMAMSVISMHFREHGPTMVLWLAPTAELVEQAAGAFRDAWACHGDIRAAVIQWRGDAEGFSHGMGLNRNTMLAASLQMAVQTTEAFAESLELLQEKVSLIVFDEAHQSIAPTYRNLVEKIVDAQGRRRLLLGLSATPGRGFDEETKELSEMYDGRKVPIARGQNPIKFLVSKRYLARAIFTLHDVNYRSEPLPNVDAEEYTKEELNGLGEIDARNQQIVDIVISLFNQGHKRVLGFTPSVKSAQQCAKMCRASGYEYSNAVHGKMDSRERGHILATYRMNTTSIHSSQVIFNCNVLTAGVDVPQTSAVVIGKPTKSDVRLQQMVGRALRGPESRGNENAYIHILKDETFVEFVDLIRLFSQWDHLWEPEFS